MKIFLAGVYSRPFLIKDLVPSYILESYHYAKDHPKLLQYVKEINCSFLLDSGAFTYMNKKNVNVDWDEYIFNYSEFIKSNNIDLFFELDIDSIVGLKEVERLRAKLERLTNKKSIPVWHKSRGLDYWKKMVKEYEYVAIGGIVTKEIKPREHGVFTHLLKIAKKNNCKVHGLGFTNLRKLNKYKFYSVDSTSWLSGSRFGNVYFFLDKTLKQVSKPINKKTKHYTIIDNNNFKEWVKFSKYAEHNL